MMSANLYGWPSGSAASGTGAFERAAERGKVRPRPPFGASAMLRATLLSLMFVSPAFSQSSVTALQLKEACSPDMPWDYQSFCEAYAMGVIDARGVADVACPPTDRLSMSIMRELETYFKTIDPSPLMSGWAAVREASRRAFPCE